MHALGFMSVAGKAKPEEARASELLKDMKITYKDCSREVTNQLKGILNITVVIRLVLKSFKRNGNPSKKKLRKTKSLSKKKDSYSKEMGAWKICGGFAFAKVSGLERTKGEQN